MVDRSVLIRTGIARVNFEYLLSPVGNRRIGRIGDGGHGLAVDGDEALERGRRHRRRWCVL